MPAAGTTRELLLWHGHGPNYHPAQRGLNPRLSGRLATCGIARASTCTQAGTCAGSSGEVRRQQLVSFFLVGGSRGGGEVGGRGARVNDHTARACASAPGPHPLGVVGVGGISPPVGGGGQRCVQDVHQLSPEWSLLSGRSRVTLDPQDPQVACGRVSSACHDVSPPPPAMGFRGAFWCRRQARE